MWTKIIAGAGSFALALALAWLYGNARYSEGRADEANGWQKVVIEQAEYLAKARKADDGRVTLATTNYVRTHERLQPIIYKSKERVAEYAQTPSGAIICLDASRVHGIDANAAALGLRPAATATDSGPTLRADADITEP
jgi:hypothetical protein